MVCSTNSLRAAARIPSKRSEGDSGFQAPSRTSYAALAKHPNIIGVKEASSDLALVQRTRRMCPEDFYIWSGDDAETAPIMLLGGKGVISVAANIVHK